MTLPSATRLSLILIALAFPSAPAQADSSDVPQWYGTIRFSKTLHRHTDDPLEFQNQPGKKFSDVKVTWSGAIRFMPGRKAVVTAYYTFKRVVDRREDIMRNCHWKTEKLPYHDFETITEDTLVSVNRQENNSLAFRVAPDGAYRVKVIVGGGKHVDKATKSRTWREFYDPCSTPELKVIDQPGSGSNNMESLYLSHVEGKAKPGATTLKGTWNGVDDDAGKFSYSWDLTLAEPQLVARAQATPSPVVRGASVTLDGKASTGKIDKYEWEFTPDGDCQMTREGIGAKLTGASVTFTALCDFTAELKVSNANASDRAWHPVTVQARKGEAWTTTFKTAQFAQADHGKGKGATAVARFTGPISPAHMHAGANQCTPHSAEIDNHWLHTTSTAKPPTWRDSGGYILAQVQDSGPFKGAWYVQSQSLKIDRQERVNAAILPGSEIYVLNNSRNNTKNIDNWIAQVKAHEAMHSMLVKERLELLGHDGDPAVRIEKLVGVLGEKQFDDDVDFVVRGVETLLTEASLEPSVANRLRGESRFQGYAHIWFSKTDTSTTPVGPLWTLGE